jgi:hypothetical protein
MGQGPGPDAKGQGPDARPMRSIERAEHNVRACPKEVRHAAPSGPTDLVSAFELAVETPRAAPCKRRGDGAPGTRSGPGPGGRMGG